MSGDVIGEALAIPFKREPYIDIPTISACPILWQEGIIVGRPKQLDRKTMQLPKHLQRLNLNAAGIDIGSKSHFVAVPEGTDDEPVREFECFTADLYRLADWLISCGVTTVAMESTGTYWIPVFEILESLNIEVKLVNAGM